MPYIYEQGPAVVVIRLMPWAIVLLLMIIPAKNRNWRAWLVLVPVLAVYSVLLLLRFSLFADSLSFSYISQIIVALATGLVMLGFLSYKLETYDAPNVLLITAGIMAVAGLVITVSFSFPGFAHEMLKMYIYGAVTLLGGISITGYHTHRNFSTDRFFTWLLVWLMITSIVCQLIYFIFPAFTRHVFNLNGDLIFFAITNGVMVGFILFMIVLPFMLLIFYNKIYRERFFSVFHFENFKTETKTIAYEHEHREGVI